MLIIFGLRVFYRTIAQGTFHCRRCGGDRQYRQSAGFSGNADATDDVLKIEVLAAVGAAERAVHSTARRILEDRTDDVGLLDQVTQLISAANGGLAVEDVYGLSQRRICASTSMGASPKWGISVVGVPSPSLRARS